MNKSSVYEIIAKIKRELDTSIDETTMIEWIAEALEFIGVITQYDRKVLTIDVKNGKGVLPKHLKEIIRVVHNPHPITEDNYKNCKTKQPNIPEDCELKAVPVDCNGNILCGNKVKYVYWFDLLGINHWFGDNDTYHGYQTVFPSKKAFSFNKGKHNKYLEYKRLDNVLQFNFAEGQVMVSCYVQSFDENGYPLIPDINEYKEALFRYVVYKQMLKAFYKGEKGSKMRLVKAEQDWHWYCKQAKNKEMMLKGVSEHNSFTYQRNREYDI